MVSIKATCSAIDNFSAKSNDNYVSMVVIANKILSCIDKMYIEVQQNYESISRQVIRLQMLESEIKSKVDYYKKQMDIASSEAEGYGNTMKYLWNNPKIVTSTDSDGNTSTSKVYDYAAIEVASRGFDSAMQVFDKYRDKYNESYPVYIKTSSTLNRYEMTKKAINAVCESIQGNTFEIKKYIRAIEDEAAYNIQSLRGVIDSLKSYLASKSIFLPMGAHYKNFVF